MSAVAATLLWNRQRITIPMSSSLDIDTGLTQPGRLFGTDPGFDDPSRIQVIPMAPLVLWTDLAHGEPFLDPVTDTVHVVFTNAGLSNATNVNVLFWDPHTLVGPGAAVSYNACFSFDTLVWTPTGPQAIHALREGDFVLAWDGSTAQPKKITQVHRHIANHKRLIETEDGALIETTDNHPFMVGDRWAPVGALQIGDMVRSKDASLALTRTERVDGEIEVFNIEVEDLHTYLVGKNALVVHNK